MSDTTTVELPTRLLSEVGHGILARAQDLHDNPDDDMEADAELLRDIGQELIDYDEGA